MAAEVVGGLLTGSLALLADAAHMLTDAGGLALALLAIRFGERPRRRNGPTATCAGGALGAGQRRRAPRPHDLHPLRGVAASSTRPRSSAARCWRARWRPWLVVNLISMRLLSGGSSESLNVKGAYFEVLSDMLGSLGDRGGSDRDGHGWAAGRPDRGAGIGLFIVPRTWSCSARSPISCWRAPRPRSTSCCWSAACRDPGVAGVHDLHVWTITSGLDAMSGTWWCLGRVTPPACAAGHARQILADEFRSITLRSRSKMRRFERGKGSETSERNLSRSASAADGVSPSQSRNTELRCQLGPTRSFPALATVLGGPVAAVRQPGPAVTSAVQHLAAGVCSPRSRARSCRPQASAIPDRV